MYKILIIDDDTRIRKVLSEILKSKGFFPIEASGGHEALDLVLTMKADLALLDLKMPGMDGIETLRGIRKIDPAMPIIIITAHGDVPTAVEAIKLGANDFMLKPPDFDHLIITLNKALEKRELEKKVQQLTTEMEESLEWLLGKSPIIKKVIEQIRQVAWSDFSIIIQGETGTGKSYIANLIHNLSTRKKGPFITVDMGAIPETLVESELFGFEKGAFTGAEKKKRGLFELANSGTLLIDEVQNMSSFVQSKLLRVVEEKKVYPLGSIQPVDINARIIAATNTNLKQAVAEKKFREDLFFRLGEFMIIIPPLRERTEDITFLAQRFFHEAATELKKQIRGISPDAETLLRQYPWPGNVRELKNVMRRAVLLSEGDIIKPERIEFLITVEHAGPKQLLAGELSNLSLSEIEKQAIHQTLRSTKGNKKKAAAMLEIDYSTLMRKIKRYNITS
jgi:DNA-binding NtrC family response regulator